ncbi:MAG: phage tail tape measure protein [Bacteroidaceae bacterium]
MASIKFDIVTENSQFMRDMKKIQNEVNRTKKMMDAAFARMGTGKSDSVVEGFKAATISAKSMRQELSQTEKTLNSVTASVGNFAKGFGAAALAVKGVNAAIQALGDSWNTLKSFQSQNATLSAILGQPLEDMGKLIESAKELGRRTVFTASQVTQLQIELSKLGFKEQEILNMSESTLQFAMATGADLGNAAATTGAALRMFGAATTEADRYTAAMAAATTNSALNFQAISDNLATFGPMAKTMGFSIEETLALFGKLKDMGIEGSTAMTSLRNIFTRVAQGKIKGMENIKGFDDFVERLKTMGERYKGLSGSGAAIKDVGTRGGTQFMTLIQAANDAENGIQALKEKIVRSEGSALGEMSSKMTNTVEGSLKMLSSAWEGFILEVGDSSLGPVKSAIDTISDLINGLTDLLTGKGNSISDEILLVVGALGTLVTSYLVHRGHVDGASMAITRQQAAYKALEAEIQKTTFLTNQEVDADLRDAVSKGKLTQTQAEMIQSIRSEIAEKRKLLQNQIAELEARQNMTEAERLEAQQGQRIAQQELDEAKARLKNAGAIDAETKALLEKQVEEKQESLTRATQKVKSTAPLTQAEVDAMKRGKEQMDALDDAQKKTMNTATGLKGAFKGAMGSLADFGKSMLASPLMWVAGTIWAVNTAIDIFKGQTEAAAHGQEAMNKEMEAFNKRAADNKSRYEELCKVLDDETQSMREKYKAYKEMKELYDSLGGYTLEEFMRLEKAQRDAIQQEAQEKQSIEHLKNRVALMRDLVEYYNIGKTGNTAWAWTFGEKSKMEELNKQKGYGLTQQEIDDWADSFGAWDNVQKIIESGLETAEKDLREGMYESAVGGIGDAVRTLSAETPVSKEMESELNKARGLWLDLFDGKDLKSGGTILIDDASMEQAKKNLSSMLSSYSASINKLKGEIGEATAKGQGTAELEKQVSQYEAMRNVVEGMMNTLEQGKEVDVEVVASITGQIGLNLDPEVEAQLGVIYDNVYDQAEVLAAKIQEQMDIAAQSGQDASVLIRDVLKDDIESFDKTYDTEKKKTEDWIKNLEKELNDANTSEARKQKIRIVLDEAKRALSDIEYKFDTVKQNIEHPMRTYLDFVVTADTSQLPQWLKDMIAQRKNLVDLITGGAYSKKRYSNKESTVPTKTATKDEGSGNKKDDKKNENKPKKDTNTEKATAKAKAEAEKRQREAEERARKMKKANEDLQKQMSDERKLLTDLSNGIVDNERLREIAEVTTKMNRDLESVNERLKEAEILAKDAGKSLSESDKKVFEKQDRLIRETADKKVAEINAKYQRQEIEAYLDYLSVMQENWAASSAIADVGLALEKMQAGLSKNAREFDIRRIEAENEREQGNQRMAEYQRRMDWAQMFDGMEEFGKLFANKAFRKNASIAYVEEIFNTTNGERTKGGNLGYKAFNGTPQQYREYLELQETLLEQIGIGFSTIDWSALGTSVDEIFKKRAELETRRLEEQTAYEETVRLQSEYENAKSRGLNEKDISAKEKAWREQLAIADGMTKANDLLEKEVVSLEQGLKSNAQRLKQSFDTFIDGVRELGSNSLTGIYEGFTKIATAFGKKDEEGNMETFMDTFNEKFGSLIKDGSNMLSNLFNKPGFGEAVSAIPYGQLVQMVMAILEILGEGLENIVMNLVNTVIKAVNGLLNTIFDGILKGKFFEQLFSAFRGLLKNIVDKITFGGFTSSWGEALTGSNAKKVAKTTERLTEANKLLQQSIDALRDTMEEGRGAKSIASYNDAVEYQKEYIENQRQILKAQMGYHSAHHSNSYYLNEKMTASDWEKVSDAVGRRVTSASELWSLTPEELKQVQAMNDVWQKIYTAGKYDKTEYLNAYLDLAGVLEELEDGLKESLTQISFESLKDNFTSTLMDMDSDAESFSENFSQYIMKAMLTNKVGELMNDQLESFYDKWADYSKSEGTLTSMEIDQLRQEYESLAARGIMLRDQIAEITGYDQNTSVSGTSKGVQGMTQDAAEELNGRFTALQIAGESINVQMAGLVAKMSLLNSLTVDGNTTLSDLRAIEVSSNHYLADIAKYAKGSYSESISANEQLSKIINKL